MVVREVIRHRPLDRTTHLPIFLWLVLCISRLTSTPTHVAEIASRLQYDRVNERLRRGASQPPLARVG